MKNYKQALYNAIEESTNEPKQFLNDYAQDFINDIYISSQYISDLYNDFVNKIIETEEE